MDIELTTEQIQNFQRALLAAFDRGEMQRVVRFGLGKTYAPAARWRMSSWRWWSG